MKKTIAVLAMALLLVCRFSTVALADSDPMGTWAGWRENIYMGTSCPAECVEDSHITWNSNYCYKIYRLNGDVYEKWGGFCEHSLIVAYIKSGSHTTHDYKEVVDNKYLKSAANCVEPAVYYKSCECGEKSTETFTYGSVNPNNHKGDYKWEDDCADHKTATCTQHVQYCKACTKPTGTKADHTFGAWQITKPATESEAGSQKRTCTCGHFETQTIPATGHTHTAANLTKVNAKAATCTKGGNIEHYTCDKCAGLYFDEDGKQLAATVVFTNPLGHDFTKTYPHVKFLKSDATCTEPAEYYKSCTRCGVSSKGEVGEATFEYGEALGHNFTRTYPHVDFLKSDATCTKPAEYYMSCTRCYISSEGEEGEATFNSGNSLGHDYSNSDWQYDEDAELDGEAAHVMYCCRTGCDDHEGSAQYEKCAGTVWNYGVGSWNDWNMDEADYENHYLDCATCTKTLEVKPHNWGKGIVTKMPDCWNDGVVKYNCPTCGLDKYETLPALGHWFETIELKSTCTGEGYTAKKCTRCGLIIGKDKVDPAGHKPGEWETVKAPTCTEAGEEIVKCTVCGVLLDSREVEPTGHDWGEWIVVTPATTEKEGLEKRVCKNDESHVETRPIAKLEPTVRPTDEPTQEPTDEPTTEPTAEPTTEPTTAPTDDASKKDDGKTDIPKTGDSRNLGYVYLMMALAAAGLCVLAATRKEGKN